MTHKLVRKLIELDKQVQQPVFRSKFYRCFGFNIGQYGLSFGYDMPPAIIIKTPKALHSFGIGPLKKLGHYIWRPLLTRREMNFILIHYYYTV